MKKTSILTLILSSVLSFSILAGVFIYGSGEATNLENKIGYNQNDQKIIAGDTDDPAAVAKSGGISSLYLRKDTAGVYLKTDTGSSTNWTKFENELTFGLPLVRTADAISIQAAATAQDGYLTQADWNTFNNKPETVSALTDTTITSAAVNEVLTYDGSAWVNSPVVISSPAAGFAFYPDDTAADIGGIYQDLLTFPAGGAEDIDSIVVTSATSPVELDHRYINGAVGLEDIPAGAWEFFPWVYVSSRIGVTKMRLTVFVYKADTSVVDLFTVESTEINNTSIALGNLKSVQPSFDVDPTDRLGIKVFAITTAVPSITLYFAHNGTEHYSYFTSPLGGRHNTLLGLQGGTTDEMYHLTSAEYTGTGTGYFVRRNSPTFLTDIDIAGTISGSAKIQAAAAAGTPTITLPTVDTTMPTVQAASNGDVLSSTTAGVQSYVTRATPALDNLASVAINTSLISDTDNTDDLGSSTVAWKDVYSRTLKLDGSTSGTATIVTPAVAGTPTITLPTVNTTMPTALPTSDGQALVATTAGVQSYATLAPNPNYVINGNFDYWQRGTSLADQGYLADRFYTAIATSTIVQSRVAFTPGQSDVPNNPEFYKRIVVSAGGAGADSQYVVESHRLEGVGTLNGKTVTLSFWAKTDAGQKIGIEFVQFFGSTGSPNAQVNTAFEAVTTTTGWAKYTVTGTVPATTGLGVGTDGGDCAGFFLWFDAGSDWNTRSSSIGRQTGTFEYTQIKLEEGSVATPFVRAGGTLAGEAQLCKRYFQKFSAQSVGAYTYKISGWAGTTSQLRVCLSLKYPMRINPSISPTSGTLPLQTSTGTTVSHVYTSLTAAGGCGQYDAETGYQDLMYYFNGSGATLTTSYIYGVSLTYDITFDAEL